MRASNNFTEFRIRRDFLTRGSSGSRKEKRDDP
jgi:hypothetical protein